MKTPLFREGIEWRRLSKEERKGKPWKYVLLKDVFIPCLIPIRSRYEFISGGQIRGIVNSLGITVCEGYAWNGCSFSPDWELLASLPHDLLYQFSGCQGYPTTVLDRGFCDEMFFNLCVTRWGGLYFVGLSVGSWSCFGRTNKGDTVRIIKPWLLTE